ncbi:MAG: carboxymuconolactone decarboxylase family protein [Acidobacteria bacterium]|nr:carboxymuconolactone decarboxylase family protein [Acidobacteriota bacterium]
MPGVSRRAVALIAVVVLTATASAQGPSPDPRVRLRQGITRDALDAEAQRTYDVVVNATSPHRDGLPAPIGMWMHSPRMAQHILPTYMYLRFGTQLDLRTKELAILITARHVNSRTQWGTHGRNARMIGVEQQVIDVMGYGRPLDGLAETDALVIRFGRELLGDRHVSADTFARALKRFGRRGVTDLAGLMAFYEFLYLSSNVAFDLEAGGPYQPLPALALPKPAPIASPSVAPADINPESRARLPHVRRDDLDADGRETYDAIVNPKSRYSRGLPAPIGMWMYSPDMARHVLPAYMYLRFGNPLGTRLTELAILSTARETSSQFQWTSHEPMAREAGLEPALIDVVKHRKGLEGLGEKDALVVRFSRELLGDRKLTAETFTRAQNAFGTVGVTDLAALMAFYDFLYLSSNATFDIQMPQGQKPLLPLP